MGKYDDAMYRYLSDNDRFADLFNAVLFDGRAVVRGELLEDDSERRVEIAPDAVSQAGSGGRLQYEKSVRDICKRMRTGESFVITAIENQSAIDYTMPWRIMRYDQMEYGRQIRDIISSRGEATEKQGRSAGNWTKRLRQDKDGLLRLWSGEPFSRLEPATAEIMAVMTDSVDILKKLETTEEGGYNMCLAVEEMKRNWKAEGIIEMGMECGLSENTILEKLQSKLDVSLQTALEYLNTFGKQTV